MNTLAEFVASKMEAPPFYIKLTTGCAIAQSESGFLPPSTEQLSQ